MSEQKENRKFTFSVEGETEKWYFEWLQKCINNIPEADFKVIISAKVETNPLKFVKGITPIATDKVTHICDIEGSSIIDENRFKGVLSKIKEAKKIRGRGFKYDLGYSNFDFELWMILHKSECNARLSNKGQYLRLINNAYCENFESLDQYKEKHNFEKCLSKLTIENVKNAISRADRIMKNNIKDGLELKDYKGFKYYLDNPSLTVNLTVENILRECNIIKK